MRKLHVIVKYTGAPGNPVSVRTQFRDRNTVSVTSRQNNFDAQENPIGDDTMIVWVLRQPNNAALYFQAPGIAIYDDSDEAKATDIRTTAVNPGAGGLLVFPNAPTFPAGAPGTPACTRMRLTVVNTLGKNRATVQYPYTLFVVYEPAGKPAVPIIVDPMIENMGEF